jgi:hypothetical protein
MDEYSCIKEQNDQKQLPERNNGGDCGKKGEQGNTGNRQEHLLIKQD